MLRCEGVAYLKVCPRAAAPASPIEFCMRAIVVSVELTLKAKKERDSAQHNNAGHRRRENVRDRRTEKRERRDTKGKGKCFCVNENRNRML